MKIDDLKLTAYALGELSADEAALVKRDLAKSPEGSSFVAETQALADCLKAEFRNELHDHARAERNILPMPYGQLFWSERRLPALAMAALLISTLVVTVVLMWRTHIPSHGQVAQQPAAGSDSSPMFVIDYSGSDDHPTAGAANRGDESPFVVAATRPISTFSRRVGTSSYDTVRRMIESGIRPPKTAVRVEEMINYFSYDYPAPSDEQTAVVTVDAASCPWAVGHELVRVGVRFKDAATAARVGDPIARAGIEVQFNPERVHAYRLIGYDAPASPNLETPDNGTVFTHARQTVTGLYEVIPASGGQQREGTAGGDLLTARVKLPGNADGVVAAQRLTGPVVPFEDASDDFHFAAAVAEFGMILRDSPHKGSGDLMAVITWADAATRSRPEAQRTAFVECVRKAASLL